MVLQVARPAHPHHLQRLAVVVMMLLRLFSMAHGTRLRQQLAPALVDVSVSPSASTRTLLWRKVHVPRTMLPGVCSMARVAIALRQSQVYSATP